MLVLASASPRRRELLALITDQFIVHVPRVDETLPLGTSPKETVLTLARRKAQAALAACPGDTVIGADTVVSLGATVFGKPRDAAHAAAMLRQLSGQRHSVYTGVAIADADGCECFAERCEVAFSVLSEPQIQAYIATGEPMDKAGAYGIQGKGALFIPAITGDYYTVMGLPVCRLAEKLMKKSDLSISM